MYKIYINEIPVLLISTKDAQLDLEAPPNTMKVKYTGRVKHLLNYIDMCEKHPLIKKLVVYHDDFEVLKRDFKTIYTEIEAAGGLIINEFNEYLFIFRRGYWDLPKGKREKTETKKITAIREVMEETGITNVSIVSKIGFTRHTFKNRLGIRNIKKSHWYLMKTHKQNLIPEKAEDITQAIWMNMDDFLKNCTPVYASVLEMIDNYVNSLEAKDAI